MALLRIRSLRGAAALVATAVAWFAGLALLAPGAAARDADGTATLGGGSDIRTGTVVPLPTGVTIPGVHRVSADNPGTSPVEVEFRAEAHPGIVLRPEAERLTIQPGREVRVPFSIEVGPSVPPGDHTVTAQLVRADIAVAQGAVTNIPAVGTTFTIRTGGEAGTIAVRSIGAETGLPVEGVLTVPYLAPPSKPFAVASAEGSGLEARVAAPGDYEAAYWLGGKKLASKVVRVEAGAAVDVTLEVNSVSFVSVAAEPEREDDRVVVVELRASVQNHLGHLSEPLVLRARMLRDGVQVDDTVIEELEELPTGVTESRLTYRPHGGFPPGRYEFEFELIGQHFTVRHSERPSFTVGAPFPWGVATAIGGGALLLGAIVWRAIRRNRRRPERRGRPDARTPDTLAGVSP